MNIERVFIHRLVRVLRVLLPLVVVGLAAVPAWNYLVRRAQKGSESIRSGTQLPRNVSVHTEGFTFSRTEGGRTLFTIHAKSNLGLKGNKGVLEDVDVIVYGPTENDIDIFKEDRKSTRLNSSHLGISYAVFCLKKKKEEQKHEHHI